MSDWLEGLAAGDEVAVVSGLDGRKARLWAVERTTKTLIFVGVRDWAGVRYEEKFSRATGKSVPYNDYESKWIADPATLRAEIARTAAGDYRRAAQMLLDKPTLGSMEEAAGLLAKAAELLWRDDPVDLDRLKACLGSSPGWRESEELDDRLLIFEHDGGGFVRVPVRRGTDYSWLAEGAVKGMAKAEGVPVDTILERVGKWVM